MSHMEGGAGFESRSKQFSFQNCFEIIFKKKENGIQLLTVCTFKFVFETQKFARSSYIIILTPNKDAVLKNIVPKNT